MVPSKDYSSLQLIQLSGFTLNICTLRNSLAKCKLDRIELKGNRSNSNVNGSSWSCRLRQHWNMKSQLARARGLGHQVHFLFLYLCAVMESTLDFPYNSLTITHWGSKESIGQCIVSHVHMQRPAKKKAIALLLFGLRLNLGSAPFLDEDQIQKQMVVFIFVFNYLFFLHQNQSYLKGYSPFDGKAKMVPHTPWIRKYLISQDEYFY